jgi:hypothetical protein
MGLPYICSGVLSGYSVNDNLTTSDERGELTSREFLYHLPCERSARKQDYFWSGRQVPEATVWTLWPVDFWSVRYGLFLQHSMFGEVPHVM